MTTVDGGIWIPDEPDWSTPPRLLVEWETMIAPDLLGGESRQSLRPIAREQLRWVVCPDDVEERALFLARLRAALKLGFAAAPLWTRPMTLRSIVGAGNEVYLEANGYCWQVGDRMVFRSAVTGALSFREVTAIMETGTGWRYAFETAIPDNEPGDEVWPMIIGRFGMEGSAELLSPDLALYPIWIRRDLGRLRFCEEPSGLFYVDFEELAEHGLAEIDVETWPSGVASFFLAEDLCYDDFESYGEGTVAGLIAGASGTTFWTGPGTVYFGALDIFFYEDFESYSTGIVSSLEGATAVPSGYTIGPASFFTVS